jgi:hypothetical protein
VTRSTNWEWEPDKKSQPVGHDPQSTPNKQQQQQQLAGAEGTCNVTMKGYNPGRSGIARCHRTCWVSHVPSHSHTHTHAHTHTHTHTHTQTYTHTHNHNHHEPRGTQTLHYKPESWGPNTLNGVTTEKQQQVCILLLFAVVMITVAPAALKPAEKKTSGRRANFRSMSNRMISELNHPTPRPQ